MSKPNILHGGQLAAGVGIGSLAVLVSFILLEVFEVIPLENSAFVGAIFGAVIAGGIGITGQLLVISQTELHRKTQIEETEKRKLETLLAKIVRVLSTLAQTRSHVESLDDFDNIKFGDLSNLMKPLKINDLPMGFSSDQHILPLGLGDQKFFNLMNILDSILANFRWSYSEYDMVMENFLLELGQSEGVGYFEGKHAGNGEIKLPVYHKLKDLQSHHIDSTYSGLIVVKQLSWVVLDHLKRRHNVDLNFADNIPNDEWKELFESVDSGKFAEDLDYKKFLVR